jgi:hypothetical protein
LTAATANRIVAFFAVGGVGITLWTKNDPAARYRGVWAIMLLSAGGAALADFAPGLVGPYFLLIIIAYIAGHTKQLAKIGSQLQTQAGVKK